MAKFSPETVKATAKSVRQTLDKIKYEIDVFQREFRWERKQIEQLLEDLESKFLNEFDETHERKEIQNYSKYYLGSIIISLKDNKHSIIDGQQRLTSLTLLLIYLNNLQKSTLENHVKIDDLIFSELYNEKSYNLKIQDRIECMDALYNDQNFDPSDQGESVKNIIQRYQDIEELFPDELKGKALPYFIDWLIENVMMVHIESSSDDDSYMIFETMNDRGLNLTSTEMLKGYILSKLDSDEKKIELNELWKKRITDIKELDKEEDSEFFKSWLRAKYAQSIRVGKKGSANEDFEKIASRFHSWVRDNKDELGLKDKSSFYKFIKENFNFYSKLFLKIYHTGNNLEKDLEHIFYIHNRGFPASYYFPLLMAPIELADDENTIKKKMSLVARFLETFIVFRSVNFRTLAYSSIRYTMFTLIKEVRNKSVSELTKILKSKVENFDENLEGMADFGLHSQNKRFTHFLLARMTNHIEKKCGIESNFENYVSGNIDKPFEIEHIWADKFEEHRDEFDQKQDFDDWRNSFGALILLPEGFNQSLSDDKYETKLSHYNSQNLLARTLNEQCYQKNPSFLKYVETSNFPFKPHNKFKKQDILDRQNLYQKICEEIWTLDGFDDIANS